MATRKFKVGDYVETDWESAGITKGEQGIIIDAEEQENIRVMFPARNDVWSRETGWYVSAKHLKLLYRPR